MWLDEFLVRLSQGSQRLLRQLLAVKENMKTAESLNNEPDDDFEAPLMALDEIPVITTKTM